MLHLLLRQRADFVLMAPEEFGQLLQQHVMLRDQLQSWPLADKLPGEQRYLICSQQVEPELLQRFNMALKSVKTETVSSAESLAP